MKGDLTTRTEITAAEVTVRFTGGGAPFADVQLAPGTYITTRDPAEADALAAAFTEAARLLRAAEPHQPQAPQDTGGQS